MLPIQYLPHFAFRRVLLLLFGIGAMHSLSGQCIGFPTTTFQDDCASYPPLANNSNVNNGDIFGVCGASAAEEVYSSINLNGGIVRICANAQITGNYNGGTIVVSCGATLRFPAGLLLNTNVEIVNYGTVEVIGDLTFQNPINAFFNASPDARLLVSGNINFSSNNSHRGYLINEGFVSVGGNFNQFEGGYLCLNEGSIIECNNYNYSSACGAPNNRVLYGAAFGTGLIRYQTAASIFGRVTNSSNVEIWQAPGSVEIIANCGSWGAATLVPNAPIVAVPAAPPHSACNPQNCFTALALPIELADYSVSAQGKSVVVSWATSLEENNDYFTVERSLDGEEWGFVENVPGAGNSNSPQGYQIVDENAWAGLSYYRLKQTDFDGATSNHGILSVRVAGSRRASLDIQYTSSGNQILLASGGNGDAVRIFSVNGQELGSQVQVQVSGLDAKVDISNLAPGVYLATVGTRAGKFVKWAD